jgi:hypothetical protein
MRFYEVTDLFKGNVVDIHCTRFVMLGMDRASVKLMESLGWEVTGQEYEGAP